MGTRTVLALGQLKCKKELSTALILFRSVGIVRSRTKGHGVCLFVNLIYILYNVGRNSEHIPPNVTMLIRNKFVGILKGEIIGYFKGP
jgi:hypothetical protein